VPGAQGRGGLAGFHPREAPPEPHGIARDARGEHREAAHVFTPPRPLRALSGPALLTVREVAEQLQQSTAEVYRLCERGDLAHVRVSNAIRVLPTDLAAYIARSRVGR
jgi:excisionase family DNA binding protein